MANKLQFRIKKLGACNAWLSVIVLMLGFSVLASAAKLYKWVDEKGNVHYSDRLPPHLAKKKHEELNNQGIILKNVERDQSTAEREQARLEEEKRLDERRKIQAEEAKQNLRDKILLDTFTTERDLLLTRDERLSMVDSIISLTISNNQSIQQQIDNTQAQIEVLRKNEREIPENLIKKQENLHGQLEKNKDFINIKTKERAGLEKQFELDLMRYRELKETSADEKTDKITDDPENPVQVDKTPSTLSAEDKKVTAIKPAK